MPWRPMVLRGQTVLARCNASGELAVEGGRVEIRYKPNDGRAYRANPRNLEPVAPGEIYPDEHCGEADATPSSKPAKGKKGSSGAKKAIASESGAGKPPPTVPEADEILVYADGACSGNPGPAGLGVVMIWDDHRRELSEFLGIGTNNIAELTAILRASEAAVDPDRPMRVYTDSSYAIGVLTKGWKAKANKELIAQIRKALERHRDVRLIHVRGHAGVPLNERADELAREAITNRRTTGWVDVA